MEPATFKMLQQQQGQQLLVGKSASKAFSGATSETVPGSVCTLCSLCEHELQPHQKRWKLASQHHDCGKNWDLASKACNKGAESKSGFSALKVRGANEGRDDGVDDEDTLRDQVELRKRIVRQYGSPGCTANDVRDLVVGFVRKRNVKRSSKMVQMDEGSFKAHMVFVRGWSKRSARLKWQEISTYPERFKTVRSSRGLLTWVPQNPEISIEDIFGTETYEAGGSVSLSQNEADLFLSSEQGGVMPDGAAIGALTGGLRASSFEHNADATFTNMYVDDDPETSVSEDEERELKPRRKPPGRPSCPSTGKASYRASFPKQLHQGFDIEMSSRGESPGHESRGSYDDVRPVDSVSQVSAKPSQNVSLPSSRQCPNVAAPSKKPSASAATGLEAGSQASVRVSTPSPSPPSKKARSETLAESVEVVHSKVAMISMPPPVDLSAFDSQFLQKPLHLEKLQKLFTRYVKTNLEISKTAARVNHNIFDKAILLSPPL